MMAANKPLGTGTNCREHGTRHMTGITGLLTPETVRSYAAKCMTMAEIANLFGCSKNNMADAIRNHPHLKAAWDQGHAELLDRVTSALMKRIDSGCVPSIIFTLKSRFGWIEEQFRKPEKSETPVPQAIVFLPENGRQ